MKATKKRRRRRLPDHISANLIDAQLMTQTCRMYHALDHPLRLSIIQFLHKNGATNVSTLHTELKMQQAVASQQLGILRRAGLVEAKRETPFVFYQLNKGLLENLFQGAEQMYLLELRPERDLSVQF